MEFGKRLRLLRNEKELTLRQLEEQTGINYSALGKYERGERQPDFDTLEKIADYFDVSIDWLLGRKDSYDYSHAVKIIDAAVEKMNPDASFHIPEALLQDMIEKKIDESNLAVIPVYAEVDNTFNLSKSNIIEYELKYNHDMTANSFFYLIAPDDSLKGSNIIKGSKILVRKLDDVKKNHFKNGKIYLVSYKDSFFIRRVFIDNLQQVTLQSENTQFPPIVIQNISEITIIGEIQSVEFNPNE